MKTRCRADRDCAVLFDMDGVIVDSMPYHFISWFEALRPLGIRVSCLYVYQKEGERWEKTLKHLLRANGKRESPGLIAGIFAAKQRIFRKYFRRSVFGGARELLTGLKARGIRIALVTSTPLREVRLILPAGISRLFEVIVSGDMVSRGKPHPDPYLKAAGSLGVNPGDCIVVENAALGIRSAKAAGMYCCSLTTSLPREYLAGSDVVVEGLGQIPGVVREFVRRKLRK